jgi:hypothetical protein
MPLADIMDHLQKMAGTPGIPTADEEALQAPTIDPVTGLATGVVFGPATAARVAAQMALLRLIGSPLANNRYGQYLVDNGTLARTLEPLRKLGVNQSLKITEDQTPKWLQALQRILYGAGEAE